MTWSSVARFSDPEACEQAMQGVTGVEILPTTSGKFDTEVTKVRFDQLWMQQFHSNLPQVISCALPADRQPISFLTELNSPKLFYCGRELRPGDIAIFRQDTMHKRFDAGLRKGGMGLPKNELKRIFKAVIGCDFPDSNDVRIVRPDPEAMSRLLKLYNIVAQLAHDTPDVLEIPEVGRALEQKLIHFMVRCLIGDVRPPLRIRSRQDATMIRFEEFLEANCDRAVYLTEVCSALGVAERTLRSCCEEHLGMGPIRYLTMRRMHLAHRALRRAEFAQTTVTRVATDHGFWELGRFSAAYRALFGESPSDTLRRPPEQIGYVLNRPSSPAFAEPSRRMH